MPTRVPSEGPLSARVLWLGEAPGRTEELMGRPFIGPSGRMVRSTLKWAGMGESDVRFSNCVRHNPGNFPKEAAGARLLAEYAAELDEEIESMPRLEVIVACGGVAATRLLGKTSKTGYGIEGVRGYVFESVELPGEVTWHASSAKWPLGWRRPGLFVVPCLHPAGIMRDDSRSDVVVFRRDVWKVRDVLAGVDDSVRVEVVYDSPVERVLREKRDRVVLDTEYNRESLQVFRLGLSFDGVRVFSYRWSPLAVEVLEALSECVKVGHNILADVKALRESGYELKPPWFCTMVGFHALHPALEVGLDDAARFYVTRIKPWKEMDHADPVYNALDVGFTERVRREIEKESVKRPVSPAGEIAARMRLLQVVDDMERVGLVVDVGTQRRLMEEIAGPVEEDGRRKGGEIRKLESEINEKTASMWDARVRKARYEAHKAKSELDGLRDKTVRCSKHKFDGLRRPTSRGCEECKGIYEESADLRRVFKDLKRQKARAEIELDRWEKGFDSANNEHLRWLLYDPMGLQLPVQRMDGSKRPTANRVAIDKLSMLGATRRKGEAYKLIEKIKRVQHLKKAMATFLDVPMDSANVVHPSYKIHGTMTGRIAGGADNDDKTDNRYAFNALNIPVEWRRMYVPPRGCVYISVDWRNVEGRLTAYFSRDPGYNAALEGELRGAPKVHAINAGIIYGIDPADSYTHNVQLSGLSKTAYDAGKRLTHAWSYGMGCLKMCRSFGITMREAVIIDEKLSAAYPVLVKWRDELVDRVLGVWEKKGGEEWACVREGSRYLVNPFGWQLHLWGVGTSMANKVIAFLPQSTGAGMWERAGVELREKGVRVVTGTYDSFLIVEENRESVVAGTVECVRGVVERAWPELGGRVFPAEFSIGMNWGKSGEDNPYGLREVA